MLPLQFYANGEARWGGAGGEERMRFLIDADCAAQTVLCVLFWLDKVLEKCQERRIFALFHKFQQSSVFLCCGKPIIERSL